MRKAEAAANAANNPDTPSAPRRGKQHRFEKQNFVANLTDEDRIRLKLRESRRRALKTGNEDAVKLVTLPGVHALSHATRFIDGGRDRFIEYVQLAVLNNHPAACAWYKVFAELTPYERSLVSFDDVCAGSGVRPADLMSVVVSCAMEMGRDVGNLIAATLHPEIVHQAAKSAKRIGGDWASIGLEDRKMMFQHSNFIPIPKSATININASASAQAAAAAVSEPTVPSFVSDLAAVDSSRRAALPAGPAVDTLPFVAPSAAQPAPVDAVLIHPDADTNDDDR